MAGIEVQQREIVRQFTDDVYRTLHGVAAVMHTGGRGARLGGYRYGREPQRPPCVTVEPRENGSLMLGMVVSRPKTGKLVYGEKPLGQWDLNEPITSGGALNANRPEHRRVLFWGFQCLQALITHCRQKWSGTAPSALTHTLPRVMVPFPTGCARVDATKQAAFPDIRIDSNSVPGQDMVDSRIAHDVDIMNAINNNVAAEDFSPVLGPTKPNPFGTFDAKNLRGDILLKAARLHVGRAFESGVTDADLLAALADVKAPMRLSLFSKIQVVPVESLTELSLPYGGSMLPAVDWLLKKKNHMLAAH